MKKGDRKYLSKLCEVGLLIGIVFVVLNPGPISLAKVVDSIDESSVVVVDVDVAQQMLLINEDMRIVDVRSQRDFKTGHIEGAMNIPFMGCSPCFLSRMRVFKDEKILVYGTDEETSQKAREFLIENGFTQVYNLIGGIDTWNFPDLMGPPIELNDFPIDTTITKEVDDGMTFPLGSRSGFSEDSDGDGIEDSVENELLEKYAPVVILHPDENYLPCNPTWFIENSRLVFHHEPSSSCYDCWIDGNPTLESCIAKSHNEIYYDIFEGCNHDDVVIRSWIDFTRDDCFYLKLEGEHHGSENPDDWITYGHVYWNDFDPPGLNIQYWSMYPKKSLQGLEGHEGDWGLITIQTHSDPNIVENVLFYQHSGAQEVLRPDVKWYDGSHPVVISARGSHESYPDLISCEEGDYHFGCFWCGDADEDIENCDRAWFTWAGGKPDGSPGFQGRGIENMGERRYTIFDNPEPNSQMFIYFSGRWGNTSDTPAESGAQGPAYVDSWFYNELSGNSPPYKPGLAYPLDDATGVHPYIDLEWVGNDPNCEQSCLGYGSCPLTYDVYLGTENPPETLVASGLTDMYDCDVSFNPGILKCSTTYYWQVIARDEYDLERKSDIWSFTTKDPADTVYVGKFYDDTYQGYGWDCFTNIQDAINQVAEGGTVNVNSETYRENLYIDKTLDLIGWNKQTTIIDGSIDPSKPVVTIAGTLRVNISGFTIEGGGEFQHGITSAGGRTRIEDNLIQNNGKHGIYLYNPENTITNNFIINNGNTGIFIDESDWNTITRNTISDNGNEPGAYHGGIILTQYSDHNSITKNTISNNIQYGVEIEVNCNSNHIYYNTFIDNGDRSAPQACDSQISNSWDDGLIGNYWNDYDGPDAGGDGIGDIPYPVCINEDSCPVLYDIFVEEGAPSWGTGGPGDPFPTIQEGVSHAVSGQSVFVRAGIYPETVTITTDNLRIIGESQHTTTIDGLGGTALNSKANNTLIRGFAIINSNIGVNLHGENNTLTDTTINTCNKGISLTSYIVSDPMFKIVNNNTITENTIRDNTGEGIYLGASVNNTIAGNTIASNGGYAIKLIGERLGASEPIYYAANNTIIGNLIRDNSGGILLQERTIKNIIRLNVFTSNGINLRERLDPTPWKEGLENWNTHIIENNEANGKPIFYYKNMDGLTITEEAAQIILANCTNFRINNYNLNDNVDTGIQLGYTNWTEITGNTITNQNDLGVYLCRSSFNTITGNTITDNGDTFFKAGIYLNAYSNENIISENIITNNFDGIVLDWVNENNTIEGNTIIANDMGGITLESWNCNNLLRENLIADNEFGIKLSYNIDENHISNNNLFNNGYGVYCTNSQLSLIFHNNFINNHMENGFDDWACIWYNATLSEGNYWGDYEDRYPGASHDGTVWDTSYGIDGGSRMDEKPLVNPCGIHYRDLKKFPFYLAVEINGELRSGAAVGKMLLDYCYWDSYPDGDLVPQFSHEWVYNNFTEHHPPAEWELLGLDWFDDGENITAYQMWLGLQWNAYAFGYNFWAHADESSDEILKTICVMMDYPVGSLGPMPLTPGHPDHIGAAIPAYGDYNNWMVIRGIHTDKNTWDYPDFPSFEVYGFWINDPMQTSIGSRIYVTAEEFITTFFHPMDLPGIPFEDGKFVAVVDPPEDFDLERVTKNVKVTQVTSTALFSKSEADIIEQVQRMQLSAPSIVETMAETTLLNIAKKAINDIAFLDSGLVTFTENTRLVKTVFVDNHATGNDYGLVILSNNNETAVVRLDLKNGAFLGVSTAAEPPGLYLKRLGISTQSSIAYGRYTGGYSPYYPTIS